jgi:hypothetical protein
MAVDRMFLFVWAARPDVIIAVEVMRAAATIRIRFFAGDDDGER